MRTSGSGTAAAGAALLFAAAPARAQRVELVMQGALDARSSVASNGVTTALAAYSPFTLTAFFDASGPNLVAPVHVPGFVSYTPSSLQLTVGGRTYAVDAYDAAHPTGLAVALFDQTTPFGPPPGGRYGVGVIQNPLADGAGIVADFINATPGFAIGAGGVVPATFTNYAGVGVTSGVCTVGTPANCQQHAISPITMTWSGQTFSLFLGSYEQDVGPGAPTYTAAIVATPEPGTPALLAVALAGSAALVRWRRNARRS